ncbi:Lg-Hsp12p [Hanseniaspora valbyensis NRRL Y-1626]|uniref:Lg-Hsp12p n=1 Tax=Hanseniaspora valbyensis NRRL Y-1626 TaxID=766949 RepID=A0A1B7TB72_9ASCO|nr:Lg-Hsp12p [Hanseniaspora valbyensis NRRL Y-1626]
MSDAGRKDFTDKAAEAIKPDSEKSYLEQAKETITDYADKAASYLQSDKDKGVAQNVSDNVSKGQDKSTSSGKSFSESAGEYLGEAKEKLGEYTQKGSKEASDAKADLQKKFEK